VGIFVRQAMAINQTYFSPIFGFRFLTDGTNQNARSYRSPITRVDSHPSYGGWYTLLTLTPIADIDTGIYRLPRTPQPTHRNVMSSHEPCAYYYLQRIRWPIQHSPS